MMGLGSHLYGTTVQSRMSLGSMNMYAVLNQVLQHVPQHWQSVPADVAFTITCSDLVTLIERDCKQKTKVSIQSVHAAVSRWTEVRTLSVRAMLAVGIVPSRFSRSPMSNVGS